MLWSPCKQPKSLHPQTGTSLDIQIDCVPMRISHAIFSIASPQHLGQDREKQPAREWQSSRIATLDAKTENLAQERQTLFRRNFLPRLRCDLHRSEFPSPRMRLGFPCHLHPNLQSSCHRCHRRYTHLRRSAKTTITVLSTQESPEHLTTR